MVSQKVPVNNIFLWFLILLHLHVILFKQPTAKASKVSGCPFQIASHFFSRQTAFFTNSFLFRSPSALLKVKATPDGFSTLFRSTNFALKIQPFLDDYEETGSCCSFTDSNMIPTSEFMKSSNLEELMPTPENNVVGTRSVDGSGLQPETAESLEVVVIGLSHHNTKVEVREKLAIPEHLWNQASTELCQYPSIREASVLSTCNRFEIYLSGPNQYEAIRDAVDYLSKRTGGLFDHATLKKNMFMLAGEDAIWHLLRVSAGLDSIVVGEGQILAQVKRCYEHGISDDVAVTVPPTVEGEQPTTKMVGGRGGKVVSRMLNAAITAGKRVRSETGISKGAVSVSSAAAEFSSEKLWSDCRLASLKEANIAIVGAGKMTKLLLHHFQSAGINKVTIVNRSLGSVAALQKDFPALQITAKLMDEMYATIAASDVVFTSTSSMEPIVHAGPLMEALNAVDRKRGLQLIDISVPRNVHEDCSTVSPRVHCYSVDDLKQVVSKNTSRRKKEMVEAELILKEELVKFRQWQQALGAVPTITKMLKKADEIRLQELEKIGSKLSGLSPAHYRTVEKVTRGIVGKLVSGPMQHLKVNGGGDADGRRVIRQFQQAFQLY